MEVCPACGRLLVPFRAKLVCRTPGCGFMENCCDGGRMGPECEPNGVAHRTSRTAAPATLPARHGPGPEPTQ